MNYFLFHLVLLRRVEKISSCVCINKLSCSFYLSIFAANPHDSSTWFNAAWPLFLDLIEQSLYLLWRHLTCYISVSKHEANSIDLQSSTPNPPRKLTQQDRVQLLEQLPRKLNFDVLDSITQVSKVPLVFSQNNIY